MHCLEICRLFSIHCFVWSGCLFAAALSGSCWCHQKMAKTFSWCQINICVFEHEFNSFSRFEFLASIRELYAVHACTSAPCTVAPSASMYPCIKFSNFRAPSNFNENFKFRFKRANRPKNSLHGRFFTFCSSILGSKKKQRGKASTTKRARVNTKRLKGNTRR